MSVPTLTRGPHPDSQCVRGEPLVPEHQWPMDMLPIPSAVGVNLAPVDTKRSLRLSVLRLAGLWRFQTWFLFLVARRQRGQGPPLPVARWGKGGRPLQLWRALTRKRKRLVCTLSNPVLGLVAASSQIHWFLRPAFSDFIPGLCAAEVKARGCFPMAQKLMAKKEPKEAAPVDPDAAPVDPDSIQ